MELPGTRRAVAGLLCCAMATVVAAGGLQRIDDPRGDTFRLDASVEDLDIESLEFGIAGPNLQIILSFYGPISPFVAAQPDALSGLVLLDTDRNPGTSAPVLQSLEFLTSICNAPPIGGEFAIDLASCGDFGDTCDLFGGDNLFDPVEVSVAASFGSTQLTIDVPLAEIGSPAQPPALLALAATGPDSLTSDCVPGGDPPGFRFVQDPLPQPPELDAGDELGTATAVSGNLIAVGIPNDAGGGSVAIYELEGASPVFREKIPVPPGFTASRFGAALALDGDTLVVGAPGTALAKGNGTTALQAAIFERLNGVWSLKQRLAPDSGNAGDEFGAAVAIDGDMIVVGAPGDNGSGTEAGGSGAAYAFDFSGATAVQMDKVKPGSPVPGQRFGQAVAADRGRIGVGSPGGVIGNVIAGNLTMYQAVAGNLASLGTVGPATASADDGFGTSVALAGNRIAVGAPGQDGAFTDSGAVFMYEIDGGNLLARGVMTADDAGTAANLGRSVAFSGGEVLAGAPGSLRASGGVGAVYTFDGSQPRVVPAQATQQGFGFSLAASGDRVVIGAPGSASSAGAAAVRRAEGRIFFTGFE